MLKFEVANFDFHGAHGRLRYNELGTTNDYLRAI
jgi:hypothetical protein